MPHTKTGMNTREASQHGRRIVGTCIVFTLLLLLALTPPLLNVNRLQRRIAASIGASLGRPVHLDRVSLHLLPVPGFTLTNLVVSEEDSFGSEPVIRANTVEVILRPSSLWRRQVEFSSIKFIDPSLNLVRNQHGEWNIQNLLMHAASMGTAPTAQRKAGPEPRFPYIEATGARVNLKVGEEKKPFSITEADFALWLPSPQEWRIRLVGRPARTDTNISDPGTIRLDGTLQRAATMAEVPVDLSANWDGTPLGEASKLISGDDAGWRGNLAMSATLVGKLSAAKLTTKVHATEVRRADFIPVLSMEVPAECTGTLDVATAIVTDPDCSLDAPASEGSKVPGRVVFLADSIDLSELKADGLHGGMTGISNAWLLDWARLFSQRIPPSERPGGSVSGTIALHPGNLATWQGEVHGDLTGIIPWKFADSKIPTHPISISTPISPTSKTAGKTAPEAAGEINQFVLAPFAVTPAGKTPPLMIAGTLSRTSYTLRLTGTAAEQQLQALRAALPPLGDGLQEALPPNGVAVDSIKPIPIDITCTRAWDAAQTCQANTPTPAKKIRRRLR